MNVLRFLFTILIFLLILATIIKFPILSIYSFITLSSILIFKDLVITKEY
jgi:hypothetical protein